MRVLSYTTRQAARPTTWWRRWVDAWHGNEPPTPDQLEPGIHQFDRDYPRRQVEMFHDAALAAGFESELVYYDTGEDVRIRRPGDREPPFIDDAS